MSAFVDWSAGTAMLSTDDTAVRALAAVRTFERTATYIPMYPAVADASAPMT